MAIAFDAASNSGYQSASSSHSWTHNLSSGDNNYLLIGVSIFDAVESVSALTVNGNAATLLASDGATVRAELWGISVANQGGGLTVAVTLTGAIDWVGSGVSLQNVTRVVTETEGAANADGTSSAASVDVTTTANNDFVVSVVASSGGSYITSDNTGRTNVSGASGIGGMDTAGPVSPAGTQTMSWQNDASDWSIAAVAIKPQVPTQLLVGVSSSYPANATIDFSVNAADSGFNSYGDFTEDVTIAIGTNPSGGTLSGTLTRTANGLSAHFDDLSINNTGVGYDLDASTPSGLTGTSNSFDIVSGGTTVTPDTATLTLSTFAPVIGLGIIPPTKALSLSTFAPTVSTPRLVTPPTASLTLTTYAPSIVLGTVATPPTKALTLTTFAPSVVLGTIVTPDTATLTLSSFAPTVLTPQLCTPATLSLIVSTFAPTVTIAPPPEPGPPYMATFSRKPKPPKIYAKTPRANGFR